MSARERNKGAVGERELCQALAEWLGDDYGPIKRLLGQARDGGGDIEIGPYLIEVKRRERVDWPAWVRQAEASAADKRLIPVIAHRRNREPWRIYPVLSVPQMAAMIREAA